MPTPVSKELDKGDSVKNFLSFIERDVKTSQMVYETGAHTKLTSLIESMVSDPLTGMINTSLSTDETIQRMVSTIVERFLKTIKESLIKVYRDADKRCLHYFIVLNQDDFENRDILFTFLDQYEELGIHHKLPVSFQFLTPLSIGKLTNVEELSLS